MKKVIFIFSRLLLGAIGGSIILGLAFYLPAKIRESKSESEWIKFPSPIEKAIKIVKTTGRSISELNIVLESVSGNLFGCKIDEVACFPYQTSEEPTFEGELVPCRFKPDSQEFSKYFPTQIIDTCGISLGEVGIIAVLLEDNTLWIPGHV